MKVWDPEKMVVIPDHYIFTTDKRANRNVDIMKEQNIKYFYDITDLGDFRVKMFTMGNWEAAPEYVTSKTAVWWDMDTCPVPDGYDVCRVRPIIELALKDLGYCGPVTITAIGKLETTPGHVLHGLSSTGIIVQHTTFNMVPGSIFDDVVKFKSENPPPATLMIISDEVEYRLSFYLCRNQQSHMGYNFVKVRRSRPGPNSYLFHSAELLWEPLLEADSVSEANKQETRRYVLQKCSESSDSALIFCRSCDFTCLGVTNFTSHLSTEEHKQKEIIIKKIPMLHSLQQAMKKYKKLENNQTAAPEYVNSKTAVWWDMDTCPVPDGYDACRVRPSIEWALKDLGYIGPVTITAIGNLETTPGHVLHGLSSTGIIVRNTISDKVLGSIYQGFSKFKSDNPPPATIVFISDQIEGYAHLISHHQQYRMGYNLVLARSCYPRLVSHIYHTAEWLWETLLASDSDYDANKQETRRYVLPQCCDSSDSALFFCCSCRFTGLSVTDFTSHLSTEKHKQETIGSIQCRMPYYAEDMSDSSEEEMSDLTEEMSDLEEEEMSDFERQDFEGDKQSIGKVEPDPESKRLRKA